MSTGNKIYTGLTAGIKLSNSSTKVEFLKGFELQIVQEVMEVVTLGNVWKNKLPGIKTWSGSFDGFYSNDSSQAFLVESLLQEKGQAIELSFIIDAETIYVGNAIVSEIKLSTKAEDKTEINFSFEGIDGLVKATNTQEQL